MLRITKLFTCLLFLASMVAASSASAQTPCSTGNCAGAQPSGCSTGCSVNLSDCGRKGALFGRRQANSGCGDCGTVDCCADPCASGGCGGGMMAGRGGGDRDIMSRVRNWIMPVEGCGDKYRSVYGGWSDLSDYTGQIVGAGPISGTFKDGFILGTARGKYLNRNTRIELDTSWRNNSGEDWNGLGGLGQLDGNFNSVSSLVNVVREFGTARVKPYAGAGIGWTIQDGNLQAMGNNFRFDDWRFAYQGIVGINAISSPRTDFYCEYRYLGNTDAGIEDFNGDRFDEFAYLSESVVFGFRFKR